MPRKVSRAPRLSAEFVRLKRINSALRIWAGDVAGNTLTTASNTAGSAYFFPLSVMRETRLAVLGYEGTTTSGGGTVKFALWDSYQDANGNHLPANLIAESAAGGFTVANVESTNFANVTLKTGQIYFVMLVADQANTYRAVSAASAFPIFGRSGAAATVALVDTAFTSRYTNWQTALPKQLGADVYAVMTAVPPGVFYREAT